MKILSNIKKVVAKLFQPLPWGGVGGGFSLPWFGVGVAFLLAACSYDESLELCQLQVRVAYEQTSFGEPQGAHVRVELKDQNAQVFVDSTATDRIARFLVPPGIYEASTSAAYLDTTETTWWRYTFNGIRSQIIVSPDSLNMVDMPVKVARKRVVH